MAARIPETTGETMMSILSCRNSVTRLLARSCISGAVAILNLNIVSFNVT